MLVPPCYEVAVSSRRRSEVVVVIAEQVQLQRDGGVFYAGYHHAAVLALMRTYLNLLAAVAIS